MSDKKPAKRFPEVARTKRVALTRERIEIEALALIDSDGIDAFSTRKLGARLGCEAMSIYHHFPSKAHILDALVDRALGGMPIPDKSLTPAQRLREFAQSWRTFSLKHPRFHVWLSVYQWNSLTGTRYMNEMLDCFYDAGLSPEMAAYSFRVLGYYVQGVTIDESIGYAMGPSSLNPVPPDVLARDFPRVAQSQLRFTQEHFDRIFEIGYGALLRELGLE